MSQPAGRIQGRRSRSPDQLDAGGKRRLPSGSRCRIEGHASVPQL